MLEARIEAPSLPKLRRAFRKVPDLARARMRAGLAHALEVAQVEVVNRTPRSGRPGTVARPKLAESFRPVIRGGGHNMTGALASTAPHLRPVERGSRPHVIRATGRKALRWETAAGAVLFARRVYHPGNRAVRMVRRGLFAARPKITRIMAAQLAQVTRAMVNG